MTYFKTGVGTGEFEEDAKFLILFYGDASNVTCSMFIEEISSMIPKCTSEEMFEKMKGIMMCLMFLGGENCFIGSFVMKSLLKLMETVRKYFDDTCKPDMQN